MTTIGLRARVNQYVWPILLGNAIHCCSSLVIFIIRNQKCNYGVAMTMSCDHANIDFPCIICFGYYGCMGVCGLRDAQTFGAYASFHIWYGVKWGGKLLTLTLLFLYVLFFSFGLLFSYSPTSNASVPSKSRVPIPDVVFLFCFAKRFFCSSSFDVWRWYFETFALNGMELNMDSDDVLIEFSGHFYLIS